MSKTTRKRWIQAILALAATAGLTQSASAAPIMLDLGATAYTGNNSPAHTEGTVASGVTTWTTLSSPALNVYANVTVGSVDVHWGRNKNASGESVTWRRPGASVASTSSGVFDTNLTRDAVISITGTTNFRDPAGLMFSGLATGQYYVYVVAHYAGNLSTAFNVRATTAAKTGVSGTVDTNDISNIYTFASTGTTLAANPSTASWILNDNYARFTLDVTSTNSSLYVFTDQASGTTANSTIAAVQIVIVPEPSSMALLGVGFLMLGRRRRIA